MADGAPLVWVRCPGFGCEAVRCASARCSVRDVIHRHCQDRVRLALPGRKGSEADGEQDWVGRGWVGAHPFLGVFSF